MNDADREVRHDYIRFQKEHAHDNEPEPRDLKEEGDD